MLEHQLNGKKLLFRVSEPFEFGHEDNPDPIVLKIVGSTFTEGKPRLVLTGLIKDNDKHYLVGIAGARYRGDSLIDILGSDGRCTVNTEFFSSDFLKYKENTFDEGVIATLLKVPRERRLLLIGDLSLASAGV